MLPQGNPRMFTRDLGVGPSIRQNIWAGHFRYMKEDQEGPSRQGTEPLRKPEADGRSREASGPMGPDSPKSGVNALIQCNHRPALLHETSIETEQSRTDGGSEASLPRLPASVYEETAAGSKHGHNTTNSLVISPTLPKNDQNSRQTVASGLVPPMPFKQSSGSKEVIKSLEAPVSVRNEGITFNIGENATVHFDYGAKITIAQPNEQDALDFIIQGLSRSLNAEYDMVKNAPRGPCTPGTRIAVLDRFVKWCNSPEMSLYWMSGIAGTGKTTLMFSICQLLRKANLLAASFFCSRSLPDCRDVSLILPTIAVQLAQQYPALCIPLAETLRRDPDILKRGFDVQLRKLIIDPWMAKKDQLPEHVVVAIDALDECEDQHSAFLQVLFDSATELPFKFLIASRPDFAIRDTMLEKGPTVLCKFILHEVEDDQVRADIVKYLESKLPRHTSRDTVMAIADLAGSLFIYASTLVKLFASGRVNIRKCVQILQSASFAGTSIRSTMMASLDALYLQVLSKVLTDEPLDGSAEDVKEILYSVVCAFKPLTRRALAEMWGIDDDEVARRLDLLRSVLSVSDDPEHPVTVFHASFPEFILDPSRSKTFACKQGDFNLVIAARCLGLMNSQLRQNICNLVDNQRNASINLDIVRKHITPGLRYAVIYTIDHYMLSDESKRGALSQFLHEFMTTRLLHWFEVLSLLRELSVGIISLEKLEESLDEGTYLASLVYHSLRLIQQIYDLVEDSPMEFYSTALLWTPSTSPLHTHYAKYCKKAARVLCGLPPTWTGPDRVINIDTKSITTIAISQDGNRIAAGAEDKTIRIWNMRHQVEECILTGHTDVVSSVIIIPDTNYIVSGSHDHTIRIWNLASREVVKTLLAPSKVQTVVLSPHGKHLASGHKDGLVCIWDVANGSLVHSLTGHTEAVHSISFKPNTPSLISASPNAIRVWNTQTGEMDSEYSIQVDYYVDRPSIACSPDGGKIVTGSWSGSRILDPSGQELLVLGGSVYFVTFLPDGDRIVAGLLGGGLRVWNIDTRDVTRFTGAGTISSVAVFPDRQKIASSSGGRISIWSLRSRRDGIGSDVPRSSRVESAAFSLDGQKVFLMWSGRILETNTLQTRDHLHIGPKGFSPSCAISASGNRVAALSRSKRMIVVWMLTNEGLGGEREVGLQGHDDIIHSISFSPDALQLVSASQDSTARIWDLSNCDVVHILHHPSFVRSASFSQDSAQVVSCADKTVHIWDSKSGQQLRQFDIALKSATLSPDDEYIIGSLSDITYIFHTHSGGLIQKLEGYNHWTTLDNGSSYALHSNGWIYHFTNFDAEPHRVIWIPSLYRPSIRNDRLTGPLFTLTPEGVQICLPRSEILVTLLVLHLC